MKKQIIHISPVQTAKVAAVLYFVFAVAALLLKLFASTIGLIAKPESWAFELIAPFPIAFFGFVFVFVIAWVYNLVARRVGGVEFTVTETREF